MGAIANAFAAYAQPLLDQTDGSTEQLNKALSISQLCYNLALLPEDKRDASLREMRPALQMTEEEFEEFRSSIVFPMIQRHQEMFPQMHQRGSATPLQSVSPARTQPTGAASTEAYPGTDRYALCPCNSGQKYKFCCGMKRR